jgi:tyrosine-protein kinase
MPSSEPAWRRPGDRQERDAPERGYDSWTYRSPPITAQSGDGSHQTPTARRVLRVARRHIAVLLTCVIVMPIAAYAFSSAQQTEYTAEASLLFRDPQVDQTIFGETSIGTSGDPQRAAATNLKLARLEVVAQRTAEALPKDQLTTSAVQSAINVAPDGTSDLVSIKATDPDPQRAARIANAFAAQFIRYRRDADRAKVKEAKLLVQQRLNALPADQADSTAARELQRRSQELDIVESLQTGNAELAQSATVPTVPSAPRTKRNVVLGLLLGLLLGAGLVALREQLDRRLKDEDDVKDVFDLPVLVNVPSALGHGSRRVSVPAHEAESMQAEAFLMLRANLRDFDFDRELKTIALTSTGARDGKTTVAWSLALAEAGAGERVLLIEADLRRPTLAAGLGVRPMTGLSQVLAGASTFDEAVQRVSGVDVIFAGATPPNPASLLESRAMAELLLAAEHRYQRVILDTPPAGIVADAIPVMNRVSGVVVAVRLNHTEREHARQLAGLLGRFNLPVLGIALIGSDQPRDRYYGAHDHEPPVPLAAGDEWPVALADDDDLTPPTRSPSS